ncbi:MAG: hypothetical protein E4H26_10300 [Flavobacteriales bacterium]|nr:MAG: hypothetical protein E4H26_10300 [Flavobacteriales bacterium]
MNTIKTSPKTEFLLGAGLNVLHQESREWLETVAFWKDESKFFDMLLKHKEKSEKGLHEYGKMLQNLDKINRSLYDYLMNDIIEHEKMLSRLIKGEKGLADGDYRERHLQLGERLAIFENDIWEFKKMVFGYVKKL